MDLGKLPTNFETSFDLYSPTGKLLSGKYNRFGHNCSDSDVKKDNPHCGDIVVEVGKLQVEVLESNNITVK